MSSVTTSSPPSIWSTSSSPGWYRVWAAISVALLATFAVLAAVGSLLARGASSTIESSTAPSLIAVQDLFACVAEAYAAATVVFLSGSTGNEDRVRRNLYLDARQRSAQQTERVAGLVGDDPEVHEALSVIAASLTTYSGQIEASRLANQADLPGAEDQLRDALDLARTDISTSVTTVTGRSQDRLDRQRSDGRIVVGAAVVVGVIATVVLVQLQLGAFRRSNRLLSLPLMLATGLTVVTLLLLTGGLVTRSTALRNATRGGYDSIATTSQLQSSVFELQSRLGLLLLDAGGGGTGSELSELLATIDGDVDAISGGADSERERAAADELRVRWDRYRLAATEIVSLATAGDTGAAVTELRGQGLSSFNGVNTTIESVLSDNREQFANGVAEAAGADRWLPVYSIVLPVLSVIGVLYGVLRRLGDYR
jgi:hypothetical protein